MKKIYFAALVALISGQTLLALNYTAYKAATAPTIDGVGDEACWNTVEWASINQPFDGQVLPAASDFSGKFKAVWTADRLYILMEITDDKLVDNRVNPADNYWNDDCTEFFIDENHTPQGHECGAEAFNAFAYHIAAVPRDKNNYLNGSIKDFTDPDGINHVVDLGADCNTANALNLDDHVNVKIKKNGNVYTWELEFKIFNDTYQENGTNTPVMLTADKVMGFAIAYCDDDDGQRDNMIGTEANHNDYSGAHPFYRFTNDLGTLTLKDLPATPKVLVKVDQNQITSGSTVNLGTTSNDISKDILVVNIGGELLSLGTVAISGDGYSVDQPSVTSLDNGLSTTIQVHFSGSSIGDYIGSLSIPSNDASTPFVVNLETSILINGIAENSLKNTLFYPNPAKDKITVNLNNCQGVKFTIFTALGSMILNRKVSDKEEVDLSGLKKGFYLVKTESNNMTDVQRLIME